MSRGRNASIKAAKAARPEEEMSDKIYEIPAEWTKRAYVRDADYHRMYERSVADPDGFWAEQAERIH